MCDSPATPLPLPPSRAPRPAPFPPPSVSPTYCCSLFSHLSHSVVLVTSLPPHSRGGPRSPHVWSCRRGALRAARPSSVCVCVSRRHVPLRRLLFPPLPLWCLRRSRRFPRIFPQVFQGFRRRWGGPAQAASATQATPRPRSPRIPPLAVPSCAAAAAGVYVYVYVSVSDAVLARPGGGLCRVDRHARPPSHRRRQVKVPELDKSVGTGANVGGTARNVVTRDGVKGRDGVEERGCL